MMTSSSISDLDFPLGIKKSVSSIYNCSKSGIGSYTLHQNGYIVIEFTIVRSINDWKHALFHAASCMIITRITVLWKHHCKNTVD